MKYAGFWKRVAAAIIDSIVLNVAGYVFNFIIHFIIGFTIGFTRATGMVFEADIENLGVIYTTFFVGIITTWLYHALLESSATQGTLGKMALGIIVSDLHGERISFGKATGRFFGMILSAIILGIGFIMVAFTEKKQGLHDILAGCLVINKEAGKGSV